MKKIIKAKWITGELVCNSDMRPSSFSEQDEMFLVREGWEYNLPCQYRLFPDIPQLGDFAEVIGVRDGQEVLIGYACPVVFVMGGVVYSDWDDCQNADDFHPSDYIVCRIQDSTKHVNNQIQAIENGCYGD